MKDYFFSQDAFRPKVLECYQRYLALSKHTAISIGIFYRGNSYFLGTPDQESARTYNIGSVSKTFTAHLILKLAEEGKIDPNRPVSDYISLKEGNYPTISELLTHTAGFGHLTPIEITLPALIRHRYAVRNPYEGCTAKTVQKCLEKRRKRRKRNAGYGYSDFSYAILALVAEQVSGVPFAALLQHFVQEELSLQNTVLFTEKREPPSAIGNKIVPHWNWTADNPYLGAGGLLTNVFDVLRYLELQITSALPFITKAHDVCTRSFSKKSNVGVCTGWHTYKNSDQLWHVGAVGTFRTSLIFNKKRRIAIAVIGNVKGRRLANVHYLAKMLYSELKMNKIDFSHAKGKETFYENFNLQL